MTLDDFINVLRIFNALMSAWLVCWAYLLWHVRRDDPTGIGRPMALSYGLAMLAVTVGGTWAWNAGVTFNPGVPIMTGAILAGIYSCWHGWLRARRAASAHMS